MLLTLIDAAIGDEAQCRYRVLGASVKALISVDIAQWWVVAQCKKATVDTAQLSQYKATYYTLFSAEWTG